MACRCIHTPPLAGISTPCHPLATALINQLLTSRCSLLDFLLSAGVSGLDLYAWDGATQQYRFVATADLPFNQTRWLAPLTPLAVNVTQPGVPLRWLLYACTYNAVVSLSIGTVAGSSIAPNDPYLPQRSGRAVEGARVTPAIDTASVARSNVAVAAGQEAPAAAPAPICWYGTSIL